MNTHATTQGYNMTMQEFADDMGSKSIGRKPANKDDNLESRVYTAMLVCAKKTVPLSLVENNPAGYKILRRVDEITWIRYPEKPSFQSGIGIDIDDELIDAVQYYVMAGLEAQRAKVLMGMFHSEIDRYNETLIETFLASASNDSIKFHQFP